MNSLKLNELSKQQMNQITGGERIVGYTEVNGQMCKFTYEDKMDENHIAYKRDIKCQCACMYANQGGSSTDNNHTANDAKNLMSIYMPRN